MLRYMSVTVFSGILADKIFIYFTLFPLQKRDGNNLDCFSPESLDLVEHEKNHSPHPPTAKRREIESVCFQQSNCVSIGDV